MQNLVNISNAPARAQSVALSRNGSVALVYTPWGSFTRGSIALGILKQCVRKLGCDVGVHYLNIDFAQKIGLKLYDHIARNSVLSAEWFFSAPLFSSPKQQVHLKNDWSTLKSTPQGRRLTEELTELLGGSEDACVQLAGQTVPEFIEESLARVAWENYEVIGFSVTFAQTQASLLLAQRLKQKYPEKYIVFGGANVDAGMGLQLLQAFPWIDYVVHGEAEESFPALLRNIFAGNRFAPVNGVSFRDGERVIAGDHTTQPLANMDDSPIPDYSDYLNAVRKTGIATQFQVKLPFESSRGCWWGAKHHCAFCGLNRDSMAFRKKSPGRVYDELLYLSRQYECNHFYAVDNILDMHYFHELLPRLAERDLDLSIFYEVKANLSREQVRSLASSGIKAIQPGIESFNSELLKEMNKGVTAIQNIQLLKWCSEEGIDVVWNVLYGFPGEEARHYAGMPELVRAIAHLQPPLSVSSVIVERFSPYHSQRDKYKLKLKAAEVYSLLYPAGKMDLESFAYYFDTIAEQKAGADDDYIAPVLQACNTWKTTWKTRPATFVYEKGEGFIVLYDDRFLDGSAGNAKRRILLRGIQAEIYGFCDKHRSFKSILEECRLAGHAIDETTLHTFLESMVSNRLMFEENDHYLSLAIRKPRVKSYLLTA